MARAMRLGIEARPPRLRVRDACRGDSTRRPPARSRVRLSSRPSVGLRSRSLPRMRLRPWPRSDERHSPGPVPGRRSPLRPSSARRAAVAAAVAAGVDWLQLRDRELEGARASRLGETTSPRPSLAGSAAGPVVPAKVLVNRRIDVALAPSAAEGVHLGFDALRPPEAAADFYLPRSSLDRRLVHTSPERGPRPPLPKGRAMPTWRRSSTRSRSPPHGQLSASSCILAEGLPDTACPCSPRAASPPSVAPSFGRSGPLASPSPVASCRPTIRARQPPPYVRRSTAEINRERANSHRRRSRFEPPARADRSAPRMQPRSLR